MIAIFLVAQPAQRVTPHPENEMSLPIVTFLFALGANTNGNIGPNPGLNDLGRRQAAASAQAHLIGLDIQAVWWSEMARTRQTVEKMSDTLAVDTAINMRGVHPLIGMDWLNEVDVGALGFADIERQLEAAFGDKLTVADWLRHWGPAWAFRERTMAFMGHQYAEWAGSCANPHVLVGVSNSLPMLAHPMLDTRTRLGAADILKLVVQQDLDAPDGVIRVSQANILRCPV